MVELTNAARLCLDEYLGEVRSCLRHCASVDLAEVERDVVEHIEHALAAAPLAVDAPELRTVLRGLGSPSQWVPQEEMSHLQRAVAALRSGPDDLRLGYLAFCLLAGTLLAAAWLNLVLGAGGMLPFLLLGLAVSFILARASLSAGAGSGRAERWLIYPSLIVVYVPVTAFMLLWPLVIAIIAEMLLTEPGGPRKLLDWTRDYPLGTITAFTFVTLGSLWFAFLSFVAWRWPEVVRDCFAPFADRFRRRPRVLVFFWACLLIFLACVAIGVDTVRRRSEEMRLPPVQSPAPSALSSSPGSRLIRQESSVF
jgi:hypothetical protein